MHFTRSGPLKSVGREVVEKGQRGETRVATVPDRPGQLGGMWSSGSVGVSAKNAERLSSKEKDRAGKKGE